MTAWPLRGSLPDYGKAVFVACGASLLAFTLNDYTLKLIFGRYNPHVFFTIRPDQLFNFMRGDQTSAFPSGHMVMSSAFAAVLVRAYFRTWPLFAGLLLLASILLVLGDWHFLSDVIAGTFVGGTIGLVAGELWCEHVQHYPLQEGWLIFYGPEHQGVSDDCMGKLCVVQVKDGATLLKTLKRGSRKGLFRLESWNAPPREDVRLVWAARVIDIRPR